MHGDGVGPAAMSPQSTGTQLRQRDCRFMDMASYSMRPDLSDELIDDIIASCDGDIRGALKALLLVNEQLETELQQLYAATPRGSVARAGANLH
jgi:hypothetical protein